MVSCDTFTAAGHHSASTTVLVQDTAARVEATAALAKFCGCAAGAIVAGSSHTLGTHPGQTHAASIWWVSVGGWLHDPSVDPGPLAVPYCCLRTCRPDGKWPGLADVAGGKEGLQEGGGVQGAVEAQLGWAGAAQGDDSAMGMFSTSGQAESKVQGVVLAQCESWAQQCWHSLFAGGTKITLRKRFMLLERAPLLSSAGKLLRNQTAFEESQTLQATATVRALGYKGWSDVTRPDPPPPAAAPEDISEGNNIWHKNQ